MPVYKYKAVAGTTGESIEGVYTGKSKEEVIQMLRERQHYPVFVKNLDERKDIQITQLLHRVTSKDIAVFCRQFYTMLNAGISIVNCLDILCRQTENKKLKKAVEDVYEEVQKGMGLSETLRKQKNIFPDLLINMVEAGEISGTLDVIMDRMATHYEKENKINNKIKGAMIYPIVLSIVAMGVVAFLLTFVMPTFVGMFQSGGVELPFPTRILLFISDSIRKYWYLLILAFLGVVYGLISFVRSDKGKWLIDNFLFRIPVVKGTIQKIVTARFTRTLSTLLSSGIPLLQALDVVAKIVGNKVVEKGIQTAKEEVRKGTGLAGPIKKIGIFPPMVDSMIAVGEESGFLDEILEKTANFYDEEVEAALTKMTALIEPLMIVVMAFIVGAIVIAMVLPMFDMMNTIKI
ncbi:Type II secretion system protein F [Thermotalea metallivorans]|uniref:Type II secretion system protein F n=1 Tax=Thermotalea metallivorans TaxID=520762 RepID=A0A140L8A1_9FIRM|nr:Type II secretion system protein F [Thermotalea metallivorans]